MSEAGCPAVRRQDVDVGKRAPPVAFAPAHPGANI